MTTNETPSRQVRRALKRQADKQGAYAGRTPPPGVTVRYPRPPAAPAEKTLTPGKGKFDGNCNRTDCQVPIKGANWFNTSTRAYYCRGCAGLINRDALRFDGVQILVAVDDPEDRPPFPSEEMQRHREARERMMAERRAAAGGPR